jgi:hypothetical protein
VSRFAAVPTAALDDDRLEALHIRVLTALCSYADKDGWCRVGQDEVAGRARTVPARVSQCIGDLVKWGWVRRQRIGKKAVNVYQVLMDCAFDPSIQMPDEQERLAPTANHVTCPPSKSNLPPEQITLAPTANPIGTPFSNTVLNTVGGGEPPMPPDPPEPKKPTGRVRGAARARQMPTNWAPDPTSYAFGTKQGLTPEEINHEADQFRNHAAQNHRTLIDWHAGFRTWLGKAGQWKRERAARASAGAKSGGQPRGGGLVAAGLRAVGEARGYGQPVPEGRGMGAGDVIDGDAFRLTGS